MDIDDDNDHYITIRNNYEHDYILKTSGKSPEDIYQVLSKSNII